MLKTIMICFKSWHTVETEIYPLNSYRYKNKQNLSVKNINWLQTNSHCKSKIDFINSNICLLSINRTSYSPSSIIYQYVHSCIPHFSTILNILFPSSTDLDIGREVNFCYHDDYLDRHAIGWDPSYNFP